MIDEVDYIKIRKPIMCFYQNTWNDESHAAMHILCKGLLMGKIKITE